MDLDARYKNPKLGASAPVRVVNEVYASGDGAHGVRTEPFGRWPFRDFMEGPT